MTNKEYLSTLSNEDWHMLVDWLFHKYALRYTNSRIAIIEWLDKEHNEKYFVKCEKCGEEIMTSHKNFCPNCGAKMIGEEE